METERSFLGWLVPGARQKALSALLMAIVAGVAGAIFVRSLINAGHDIAEGEHYLRYLWRLPLIVGVFLVAKRVAYKKMAFVAEQSLEQQILTIANSIRQAELPEIETQRRADIYSAIADARTVTAAAENTATVVRCVTTIFFCWLYLFAHSIVASIMFVVMLFLLYLLSELYEKLYTSTAQEEHAEEESLFQIFHHLLDGHKELAMNRLKNDDLFTHYLQPAILRTAMLNERQGSYVAVHATIRDSVYYLVIGCFVFFLSWLYTTPTILSLLTVSLYLWPLIIILFNAIPGIAEGKAAMDRLYQLADNLKPGQAVSADLTIPVQERVAAFQELTLQDVQFSYATPDGASEFTIGPLSLTIKTGEILFIAGGNGSGKTTLLKVLTGLYPHSSGAILLNERPVQMCDHRYLFTAVFNDFHVFDSLYGLETVDGQQVNAWLLQMELLDKVQWKDGHFTTLALSNGQKRRLALVVALMEQKPIYIFDEWAADQALNFRRYFYEELLPTLKQQGKTVIAVTHDDHYYYMADRVIRMEYGTIVEGR